MGNYSLIITAFFAIALAPFAKAGCIYEQTIQGENLQIGTMLTWSTAHEENNAKFIVEKSEDGINFFEIGSINGAGDSEELKEYNFLDVMANAPKTYYRLKQVDTDGSFSFSEILTVRQEFSNHFMVARMSAVATTDLFEVTLDAMAEGNLSYDLTNWKGELIVKDELFLKNGLNEFSVDLTDQKAGIYKLTMSMKDETETLVLKRTPDEIEKKPNVASKNKGVEKGKN